MFNPATQVSVDNSDIPEGQQMSSGKKLIRKVKKGTASGMSKGDLNTLSMGSSAHVNLTGNATTSSKTTHGKHNISLQ